MTFSMLNGSPIVRTVSVRGNYVEPSPLLLPTVDYNTRIEEVFGNTVEAHSRGTEALITQYGTLHSFVNAALTAFNNHYPLVLSPDMIWLLIAQAFALHVNANAEAMRHRFVVHEGKKEIVVIRNTFIKGFAGNDWEGVFSEFSHEIREVIGNERHSLIVQSFSTTGIVEQAAVEVTLMDAMQQYFEYKVRTRCGIPTFVIEGETEDWHKLRNAALLLEEYDLSWWIPQLKPILDALVMASEGEQNEEFWGSFFSYGGGSGGPFIGGYINTLFPYTLDRENKSVRNYSTDLSEPCGWAGQGTPTIDYPSGVSVAPFLWQYYRQQYRMDFVAGFLGATQDEMTRAIRPSIGWGIRDRQ